MAAVTTGRFGTLREPRGPALVVLWLLVGAIVIGTNLWGGDGDLSLDRDALRYDGNAISIGVLDYGDQTKAQWEAAVRADPLAERVEQRRFVSPASAGDKRAFYALFIAEQLAIVFGVVCLERMIGASARRRPFAAASVWWLRGLSACVAVGGILLPVLTHAFERHVIARESAGIDGPVHLGLLGHGPGQVTIALAVILLVLSEVWKRGMALREDAEATI